MSTELQTVEEQQTEPRGAMIEVAASRQASEVQAGMMIAKRFPRDETASIERIKQACRRPGLAEQSQYSYPRGGTKVSGPSIRLAESLARSWGNIDFGVIELEQREGESDVMAYCWDLETNVRETKVFTVKHERHTKRGVSDLTDPRDIYEMVANQGARRLRSCILGIVPGDVQDIAVAECRKTLVGQNKEPLVDRVRKMVSAFNDEFKVSQVMIELHLGHKLDACDEHEFVKLRGIFQSLRDGQSTRDQWFDVTEGENIASHREQAKEAAAKSKGGKPPASSRSKAKNDAETPLLDVNDAN